MNDEWNWWFRAAAYASFAALGGVMGHLMRMVDNKDPINWARACLEGASAGFVGLLMLFVCDALSLGQQWTGVIVGVSGWLGANVTIRMLESIVRKRLGIDSTSQR